VLIEIAAGESTKSLDTVGEVYERLAAAEIDRAGAIFALGGGVVGDLGGFVAATWLRGIAVVQIPTTLVAQVDSALGGKTGINHRRAKNLIGAFHQPRAIVADVATLASLPEREFREGLAEVIKYGAIMDAPMIGDLERGLDRILAREPAALELVVERSLRHKATVVAADEREAGLRRILNFGHTVGHATALSERHAGLGAADGARLLRLIERAGLPIAMPPGWRGAEFARALRLDKKRADDAVEFVLLDRLGHALTRKLAFDAIIAGLG
jgi:3-dehydroquinate synthase